MVRSTNKDGLQQDVAYASFASLGSELAQTILEAVPTVLYVYNVQKKQSVFQNRRFGELLGHPPSNNRFGEWTTFIHHDDADLFVAHRDKLKEIRAGETLFWEFRMRDAADSWRWFQSRDSLLSTDAKGHPLLVVGSASEITEQKHAEQSKALLADEMRHRARNLVAIVQAIGRMSRPKNQPEVNKYIDVFMGRLLTLLNTGGIVLSSESRTADLEEIARTALAPFVSGADSPRISMSGQSISLSERIAGGLALAFHELATNAFKYGALSVEEGSVSLTWTTVRKGNDVLVNMKWQETGGPTVSPPASEGFGKMVIRQSVAREPGGQVTFDYVPEGLHCIFEFQIAHEPN
jgi:two-component sensor histidine kinase